MNRFQKKCFITSMGVHLLLLVMFFVGSAFLSARNKGDDAPILDFVSPDMIASDGNFHGGGGPMMRPPTTQPPTVQQPVEPPAAPPPVVAPQPQPKPEVVKAQTPEPPKIIKPSPEAIEVPKEPKHKIVVDTTLVTSNDKAAKEAKDAQRSAERAAAKRAADAQRRLASLIGNATHEIKSGLSSGTDVKFNAGFGGSGPAYASWLSIVKTIYYNEWIQRISDGATDDSAVCVASVTIAKDGTVLSSYIKQGSGNAAVDRSIQSTLDRVKFTHAFPDTSNEEKTTLEIYFSVKALKQLMG
jgi:outer membrane biosynthesis protein TonB